MDGDEPSPEADDADRGIFSKLKDIFSGASADEPGGDGENGDDDEEMSDSRRAMIERVVAFDEKKVVDVMAPRADIFAVEIDTPLEELIRTFADAGHSRMPIFRGDLDDPVGMVHIKDVVGLLSTGGPAKPPEEPVLKTLRREVLYAPPSMRVTDLLLRMQASRIHMALVIDEYGGTDGLVTIEDLVEEIVGDINDEHDEINDPSVRLGEDGSWDADARVELDAFTEETGIHLDADDDEIDTVGGFVVSLAGRVPQRGEIIAGANGYDFEITEADARKVRRIRILITKAPPQAEAAE